MSEPKVMTTAVCTVVLEVPLSQPWGADCTMGQVHKQAVDEAERTVTRMLQEARLLGMVSFRVEAIKTSTKERP